MPTSVASVQDSAVLGNDQGNILNAYDLRTEHQHDPLGIDVFTPRFSWRLRSASRGARQEAYRIAVDEVPFSPASTGRRVWDSGWCTSSDGVDVEYQGEQLQSSSRCRWVLELRDQSGVERIAGNAWFEMGLLHPEDFIGRWMHKDPIIDGAVNPPQDGSPSAATRRLPPADHYRGQFNVGKPVARARVYATARGLYVFHLNGQRVGNHELAPGWTDYRDRVVYQCFDVTDSIKAGINTAGIVLSEGWWSGFFGSDRRRQGYHYGEMPEAWGQVLVEFTDGTTATFGTGESWSYAAGPILYSDLIMGECYDARRELGDWTAADYDASGWQRAHERPGDLANLVAMRDEPITVVETLPAVSVERNRDSWIIDFGQNISGRVRFHFRGETEGTRIQLRYGEVLQSDGSLYTENLRTAEATDFYVCAGRDTEEYEPTFTSHGFRYAEVTGCANAITISDATAIVIRNSIPWTGSFTTSDDDVNQLERNIRWGQRDNFVAVPTDCPQRDERFGWTADVQVFFATSAYNADVQAFFTRWMRDVRFGQTADGSFPDVAPKITILTDGAPAWGDAGVIIPWGLYRMYGDKRLLAESFESMTRWIDNIERHNPDLIWRRRVGNNYGDWLQIDAETRRDVLATAYFAHSTALVANAADALGLDAASAHYRGLAARIRAVFESNFVDVEGRVAGDTQTGYLLALSFDLVSELRREQLARHLVRTLEEHGGTLTTGFVGVGLLCPVLSDIGRDDLAYQLLHHDGYPSWLYSVRNGATTIWERWDGWTAERGFQSAKMNSFNHYCLGSIGEWFYRYVAGIDQRPGSTAFRELAIAPRVGGKLTSAAAEYETPVGLVRSSWRRDGPRLEQEITIPPGSSASVRLPGVNATEGGRPIAEAEGVSSVREDDESTVLMLDSGSYSFECQIKRKP